MGRKPISSEELYRDLIDNITNTIQEQINDEYTEMKLRYLDDLDYFLEAKRNDVVKKILDGIDVLFRQDDIDIEPVIQIKIIKNREIDRDVRR